ncbi:hypothetical protein MHU86_23377 [Fragilaria crotonensis]|nr:hypothetical protein MHU86_23377 [Fragilaria crotonensis]
MNHVTRTVRRSKWHETIVSSSHQVSTGVEHNFGVPLTIADVHLRHEQLPFAYFFPIPLCEDQLLASLSATLPQFAVLGGAILDDRCLSIQCRTTDFIPCTFSTSDQSKEYWLMQRNILRRRQSPELLPLFSPLSAFEENLATINITTLDDGCTVIGMTVSHMVADAASCFHFLNCWGNQMQRMSNEVNTADVGLNHQSNQRSLVTCSGMMTHATADVMGLIVPEPGWADNLWSRISVASPAIEPSEDTKNIPEEISDHDYIHLHFPDPVLIAMKAHGMSHSGNVYKNYGGDVDFVSINDMLTAYGWLMKRELSRQIESNVSMVVNLRGRFGIDAMEDNGLIGNGITHLTVVMPGQVTNEADPELRISIDVLGKPPKTSVSGTSFSTTAWGSFPIWDIEFVKGVKPTGFHGLPAHPMPVGEMFASIIVPSGSDGGFTYQLLAPKCTESQARAIHERLCALFLAWQASHVDDVVK